MVQRIPPGERDGKWPEARMVVESHHAGSGAESTLATDVRRGLGTLPRSLPAKYLYDDRGSRLFDQICDTPEYYQTRTEQALLERIARPLLEELRPTDIVELGSGAARKTRALLDAAQALELNTRYVPFDVSEGMLRQSARQLLAAYPWLRVHGVVGDYDHHLDRIPKGERRLVIFLGGTIGNFTDAEARRFLSRIAATLGPGDRLLLGTDLVKDRKRLEAAYNDGAGITAAFNQNLLHQINRELGADFDVERFEHLAFFNEAASQIEMHLRALGRMKVRIPALDMKLSFADGETIHTEISRKFTRESVVELYGRSGFEMIGWNTPADESFAISLARRVA